MKHTITIGIPTYEAGESLISTLNSIYTQSSFNLVKEVLLIVDGNIISREILSKIKNPKLKVVLGKNRKGQSGRINDIFKYSDSELLILTNDDVIWDSKTLKQLVKIYNDSKSDLIAGEVLPLQAQSIFEQILKVGIDINREIYSTWNNADNYLTCNGRLMALSRNLYKKVTIPEKLWNNDAFLYLYTKINHFKFTYSKDAIALFRSPDNLTEHIKQSSKFRQSLRENSLYFKEDLQEFYQIPQLILLGSFLKVLLRNPMKTILYLVVSVQARLSSGSMSQSKKGYWNTDKTTKRLEVAR